MDKFDRSEENITQDIPKVPIKTYRWEDVKRSRRKGAYPWTHLSKPPFDGEIDEDEYTMDAFRRSRSTSTLGKSDIQYISDNELQFKKETSQDNLENQFEASERDISKLKASSSKDILRIGSTRASSLAASSRPENKDIVRSKSAEPRHKRKLSIESGKRGASLSKLGIMDKFKSTKNKLLKRSKSDASDSKKIKKVSNEKTVVTKATKSKLAPVKDESPVYIHIPLKLPPGETDEFSKYEFESPGPSSHSASLTKLQNVGSGQRKLSLMGILAELKKVQAAQQKQKLAAKGAESIDINEDSQVENLNELDVPRSQSETEIREEDHEREPTVELLDSTDSASTNNIKENKLNIEEILNNSTDVASTSIKYINSELENNETFEPVVNEPEENSDDDNISQYLDKDDNYEQISEKSTNISSENLSKIEEINKQSKQSLQLSDTKTASTTTLETALSKWKQSAPATKLSIPKAHPSQRAKSEEPKRKRKSSIDSSYSRKSLSKAALAKRFKEATDKIKFPKLPSFGKLNKKPKSKNAENIKKKTASDSTLAKIQARQYPETPVYIHIPLKPPPGTTDEFSNLEEKDGKTEQANVTRETREKVKEQISIESSDTTDANIQFIYLTAPSDDEILDSNIPETPSESDKKFFENMKEDDLKILAKSAISKVYPDNAKLETVTEDEGNGQHKISAVLKLQVLAKNALEIEQSPKENLCKIEEVINVSIPVKTEETVEKVIKPISVEPEKEMEELIKPPQVPYQINQQMFIDEEDGLKLSDAAIAMINEEMAKEFNKDAELPSNAKSEGSPALKKKVSFKRTSSNNGDSIYEDLELNPTLVKDNVVRESAPSPNKENQIEAFQSMSVEEQKSYLDKDVVKATSLAEDYNKWSPLNDHEYEPVNPPPDDIPLPKPSFHPSNIDSPPKRHAVEFSSKEADNKSVSKEDVRAQDVQNMMEEYFVKTPPKTITPILKESSKITQLSKEEIVPSKKEPTQTKRFNDAVKNQAGKLKTKLQKFKNASIKLPPPPKFPSSKLKKPNFTMPKMPQRPSLASLGIARKNSSKDSWKERQFSTESNVSSSTGNIFDFRTFPRIFKKNKRKESPSPNRDITPPPPEFATVPRMSKKKNVDSSWTRENQGDDSRKSKEFYKNETKDVIRIPLHSEDDDSIDLPSHTQYREDIDIDDDYNRENINRDSPFSKDYLKRWDHGEFHENQQLRYVNESDSNDFNIHNYNNDMEKPNMITKEQYDNEIDLASGKEEHSSGSLNERRQGVLEEIDSDEFFLREKGISQENIEVGKYLSSEIREAFRNPTNALSQFQSEDREYDLDVSDQSEPSQNVSKRKPLRKPKRKKTPHVSREQISFDQDSVTTEPDEYLKITNTFNITETPTRPKRKNNKKKNNKPVTEDVIPYQETIPIEKSYEYPTQDDERFNNKSVFLHHTISDSELQGFYENELQQQMYENEFMQGIEQPEIQVSDFYNKYENFQDFQKDISDFFNADNNDEPPIAPKRKQRSLKSLTVSEPETNVEHNETRRIPQNEIEVYRSEEYIIPTPEPPKRFRKRRSRTHSPSVISQEDETIFHREVSLVFDEPVEQVTPPQKSFRKHRSRTHSPSIISQQTDDRTSNCEEFVLGVHSEPVEEPTKPKRRSRTHSPSIITQPEDEKMSCDQESIIPDVPTPVVEEVCVEEVCVAELCDNMGYAIINKSKKPEPPLPPSRFPATPPARRKRKNKQRDLEDSKFSTVPRSVNGNVPLRPLRNYSTLGGTNSVHRSKSSIQQDEEKENIDIRQYAEIDHEEPVKRLQSGEVIKKMKDRPLPAPPRPPRKSKEFREVFRDISHERNIPTESQTDLDKISTNEVQMESEVDHDNQITDNLNTMLSNIESEILSYDHEETVTHGSLVIQPINNSQILPLHELTQNRNNSGNEVVRIIPIEQSLPREIIDDNEFNDEDETSYIPEEFKKLRNPEEETGVQTNVFEDYDETSDIPEEFKQLKDPEETTTQTNVQKSENEDVTSEIPETFTKLKSLPSENQTSTPVSTIAPSKEDSHSLGVLKAEKLQVQNLDVDKLRVNELQATKIIVSELDGVSLQVNEINSKSGNLVISGIELPPQLINQMLDQLQAAANTSFQRTSSPQRDLPTAQTDRQENKIDQSIMSNESDVKPEEKTAPRESTSSKSEAPPVPPRYDSKADLLDENLINITNFESESSKLHQVVQHQDSQEQVDSNQQELDECCSTENPPTRPPRKSSQIIQNIEECLELPINVVNNIKSSDLLDNSQLSETIQEEIVFTLPPTQESLNSLPHTDSSKSEEEPPPRPPQPLSQEQEYLQSQPPLSFYTLRSPQFIEFIEEDIPLPPRRKRHHKSVPRSKSSSDDSVLIQRRHRRSSEPSIPRLTGQLVRACRTEMERSIKRLISHFRNNVLQNADGQQDSHVMILILLILIAGLILLSCDEKINIHHHHWEYFNPPKDL